MKKIILALLALLMLFAFVSCDETVEPPKGEIVLPEEFYIKIYFFEDFDNPDTHRYIEFFKTTDGLAVISDEVDGFKVVFSDTIATLYTMVDGIFDDGAEYSKELALEDFLESASTFFFDEETKNRDDLVLWQENIPKCGQLFMCNVYKVTIDGKEYEIAFDRVTNMAVFYRGPGQKSGWEIHEYYINDVTLPEADV